MKQQSFNQQGQALVTLLFLIVIAMMVTMGATMLVLINAQSATRVQEGQIAYSSAEGGVENAMLQMLRNPSYTGEILNLNGGTATVTVTGTGPYTITSMGKNGNFVRQLQVTVSYVNNILTVTTWNEIF